MESFLLAARFARCLKLKLFYGTPPPAEPVVSVTNKKSPETLEVSGLSMAAGEGFEPSHTESESAVLPLHKPAISIRRSEQILLYRKTDYCQ